MSKLSGCFTLTNPGTILIYLLLIYLTLGSEMLEWRCGVKLIFNFRKDTNPDTTKAHKRVPNLCEESWQSHLSRAKQFSVKHEGHGRLPCDMFSNVKKTLKKNLACCTNLST